MTSTTLVRSGLGRKDSNAALADEFFATLEATHGNSAQAKSLLALLRRAEARHAERTARKQAKRADSTPAPKTRKASKASAEPVEQEQKPAPRKRRESNAEARERRQRIAQDNSEARR